MSDIIVVSTRGRFDNLERLAPFLGKRVRTPDGVGVLIGVDTPCNGLYVEADRTTYKVWYGTENAHQANGWVHRLYNASDIEPLGSP